MERLKETMAAFKRRTDRIREFSYDSDVREKFCNAMYAVNEQTARQYLKECTPQEFKLAACTFPKCALKWGGLYVEFLEQLAEEKGWTDYTRDMIGEARAEVK
jgi:hypothetical protein